MKKEKVKKLVNKILCLIGIHEWTTDFKASDKMEGFTIKDRVYCKRCGKYKHIKTLNKYEHSSN